MLRTCIRQHTSAYVTGSIRQHTAAYVAGASATRTSILRTWIRQHTSAYVSASGLKLLVYEALSYEDERRTCGAACVSARVLSY